jgi:predicted PurR-regulated permease PerM
LKIRGWATPGISIGLSPKSSFWGLQNNPESRIHAVWNTHRINLEHFRTGLFFGLLTLAVGLCCALAWPFLSLIAWAVVLAVVAYPIHRRLTRWIRQPSMAAALSCLVVVVAVVVPVTLIVVEVVDEATELAKYLQSSASKGELSRWLRPLELPAVDVLRRWLEQRIDLSQLNLEAVIRQTVGQATSFLTKQSMGLIKNAGWGFIQGVLTLVTLFFLLRDAPRLRPAVRAFIPLDEAQTDALLRRVVDTIHATVFGTATVAAVQGTLGGLAFWALGLPSPLLWGTVITLLGLIPLLGSVLVWAPAALWLAMQGAYWKALALAFWGALVISQVDNLLRPLVIGTRTRVHLLLVFFSVWGGLLLLGPLGLVLGPVILAATLVLMDVLKLKLVEGDTAEGEPLESPATGTPI